MLEEANWFWDQLIYSNLLYNDKWVWVFKVSALLTILPAHCESWIFNLILNVLRVIFVDLTTSCHCYCWIYEAKIYFHAFTPAVFFLWIFNSVTISSSINLDKMSKTLCQQWRRKSYVDAPDSNF